MRSLQRREGKSTRSLGTWPQQDPWHLQVRGTGMGVLREEEGSEGFAQGEKELSQIEELVLAHSSSPLHCRVA
jgi:hypothetical protein